MNKKKPRVYENNKNNNYASSSNGNNDNTLKRLKLHKYDVVHTRFFSLCFVYTYLTTEYVYGGKTLPNDVSGAQKKKSRHRYVIS